MIDVSRFLSSEPEETESPAERRARISAALERTAETTGMIVENQREDNRLRRNYRQAISLSMDMRDLMGGLSRSAFNPRDALLPEERAMLAGQNPVAQRQMLTEQFPTMQDDGIMEELYQSEPMFRPQPKPQPKRQILQENMPAAKLNLKQQMQVRGREQRSTGDNWTIKKFLGETRGGDTIPIWKVTNKKTGTAIDKLFRIEAVANRIAMIFNETGDLNDPRAISLIGAYDKRDKLLKEARALEKSADGKPMKTERLRAIRAEINQLDYRLGL
jgi:hypothetical protein